MDFFSDWRFWFSFYAVVLGAIQWFGYSKITGNNVEHLEKDVSELKEDHEKFTENYNDEKEKVRNLLAKIAIDVGYIKGKSETESKVLEILEKHLNK